MRYKRLLSGQIKDRANYEDRDIKKKFYRNSYPEKIKNSGAVYPQPVNSIFIVWPAAVEENFTGTGTLESTHTVPVPLPSVISYLVAV